MKTIQPFITAGWHTVPLKGELKRLENGKKTLPEFEKDWRVKYTENKNEKATKIGGAITGEVSGIIAIDCDNEETWKLFRSLDPDYDFLFVSKGKGKIAGTVIYAYDADLPDSFQLQTGEFALDFYSNNGFVYLPTEANETKEPLSKVPDLKAMPMTVKILLKQLLTSKRAPEKVVSDKQNVLTASCLQPIILQFVNKRQFMPGLFKIITPKAFRDLDQYVKEGFLHPANVPEGRGSEYLSKVSAILGSDISINQELYIQAMHDINDLFSEPMDALRLDKTIVSPMIEGNARINGEPIWRYDENWDKFRLILNTKRQTTVELAYDDKRGFYYIVDQANEHVQKYGSPDDLLNHIRSIAFTQPTKAELLAAMPLINVTSDAAKDFGFDAEADPTARTLNTFKRTPELEILAKPELYERFYKVPENTLKYFETLVPDAALRTYLLRFMKRKLTTFEYSPIVLYFMGVQGSGKDTFVEIIERIVGQVTRPTTKEFLEIYNGYMLDTYFVQLDEYGNQLTKMSDREEALGKLKAYTGKQVIQIRRMRTDGFDYRHNVTFIMTANKNPLMLEDNDRRVCFIPTPNVLRQAEWVKDIAEVHDAILAETKDFCYWLATEVEVLPRSEYVTPPESPEKHKLIADSMFAGSRIVYAFKHKMHDYLKSLANEHGCTAFINSLNKGRVYTEEMEEFYEALTDYNGDMRALNKLMRAAGFDLIPTTKAGTKAYYYNLGLDDTEDNPFKEQPEDDA